MSPLHRLAAGLLDVLARWAAQVLSLVTPWRWS